MSRRFRKDYRGLGDRLALGTGPLSNCDWRKCREVAILPRQKKGSQVKKKSTGKSRKKTSRFRTDKRRKHRHWQVTVYYHDGEKFARVYIDRERAVSFANRQKRSPIVKATRILEVN